MKSHMRTQEDMERMTQLYQELPNNLEELEIKLTDPDPLVRHVAVSKLRQLEDPRAVDPLLRALDDENSNIRGMAVLSLSYYADVWFLPPILEHLANDSSPMVRVMSAMTAGSIGTDEAMEMLKTALGDSDEHVRMTACLEFAHHDDRRALPEIQGLLSDTDDGVRTAAAKVLFRLHESYEDVMNVLLNDPSWEVRKDLVHELIWANTVDERLVTSIEQLMKEPDAVEYEFQITQIRAAIAEYQAADDDSSEEMSEEDLKEMREFEEMQDKPLAELLEKARALLDGRDENQPLPQ